MISSCRYSVSARPCLRDSRRRHGGRRIAERCIFAQDLPDLRDAFPPLNPVHPVLSQENQSYYGKGSARPTICLPHLPNKPRVGRPLRLPGQSLFSHFRSLSRTTAGGAPALQFLLAGDALAHQFLQQAQRLPTNFPSSEQIPCRATAPVASRQKTSPLVFLGVFVPWW
jgi:hypothetical protein